MPSVTLGNGRQIVYEEYGNRNGTTVIFIHPPGMGRKVFARQHVLGSKVRVIFPDLTGHGDSDIPSEKVTIEYYCKELISLLNALHINSFVLCGYSAGGAVAQHMCLHYGERVLGLILIGGYPAVINQTLSLEHKLGMYMVKNHKQQLATVLARSHTSDPSYRKILIEHMRKANCEAWYLYYKDVLCMNIIRELPKLTMPLLLIYGTKSDGINRYSRYYKKYCKLVRIVFIKRMNHQIPTKSWKVANAEISDFVSKL
ncbi:alpha/beta fold hydrolase [Metabacillus malikii]|uniref:Pimeloyl-ACP methyl ester carboxylesterase n=1 Tax=Metabacillus malikii TaxID=1504265 RepID=A0ABT9Z9K4_9BACI|nr:alpha/beta hydrolase [Metabacillus malikii]MDQ0228938.1 pimeloyl-ACP methyl ester carboxylesterase [Metabacillus malikii]